MSAKSKAAKLLYEKHQGQVFVFYARRRRQYEKHQSDAVVYYQGARPLSLNEAERILRLDSLLNSNYSSCPDPNEAA